MEHRACRCGGSSHWMQSREREPTRRGCASTLGGWQIWFPGWARGEFTDEAAATFTMVNGWSKFRPQGPTFTVPSRLSAWTKLDRGPGNLRDVGSPVVGDKGSRRRRRCEQREGPTEWQVQGSPGGTGTVLSSVSGGWVFRGGAQGRRRGARAVSEAVSGGFTGAVRRVRGGPRRCIARRGDRPRSECDPASVRLRSELGLKPPASGQESAVGRRNQASCL